MKRPERQPGTADVKDFFPRKREAAAVAGLAGAALFGVAHYALPPQETPSEATSPATSEASVAVPYSCETPDGTVMPYEVTETSDTAVITSGTGKDFVALTCADGSMLGTNTVEVLQVDEATTIPQSTEVLLGNVPAGQDPVLEVSVDKKTNTVTVTTDPATSIRDVKN